MPHEGACRDAGPSREAREYIEDVDGDVDEGTAEASSRVDEDSHGVVSFLAAADASGERLDKWLAAQMTTRSRSRLQHWIVDGLVRIDGRTAHVRDAVWPGARIDVETRPDPEAVAFAAEPVPFDIVHEDDAIIVVDKRAGLVVHPATGHWGGTLLNGLLHHAPSLAAVPRAGIVHRLDKDTSGLMVVAKTVDAQTQLVRQLQARTVRRDYVGIARGATPERDRIEFPIGRDPRDRLRMKAFVREAGTPATAKPAATRYERWALHDDATRGPHSLVACSLETGRTHQIRVHLQAIGHALVGDPLYGPRERQPVFDRQALHAWRLGLVHPVDGRAMRWTSSLPDDLVSLAAMLGLDASTALALHAD